jgi:hypothetical protein
MVTIVIVSALSPYQELKTFNFEGKKWKVSSLETTYRQ